jgi:allantoin permease
MGEYALEQKKHALLAEQSVLSLDLLPTKQEARTWRRGHFFSIWMGSVHNVPSYATIGGFFAIGLSIWQVFFTILISSLLLAAMMVLNGHAGAKFGIPFSMLLRLTFGVRGAILPGVLRGVVAAIMWFGLQTYAGSLAVTILLGVLWPSYLTLGGDWSFFGLGLPNFLSFLLFWMIHLVCIFGGMDTLGKLTKILSPLIFLVFGGMAIWAINLAGGIDAILSYQPKGIVGNQFFVILTCVTAILSTWVAQILSVSDVTRFASTNKDQTIGQILGLLTTYLLFAVASISIIVGSEVAFGVPIWNVLEVVDQFDNKFAIILSLLTICLSTLSVNIIGNIIPAGNQLASLYPKRLNFISGAVFATIIGILIMPWKLMENSTSIFAFLNIIGGLLSPVIGVLLTHYYLICKKEIHVQSLYRYPKRMNWSAMVSVLIAGFFSLVGNVIPALEPFYRVSWFTGIGIAVVLYLLFFNISKLLKG